MSDLEQQWRQHVDWNGNEDEDEEGCETSVVVGI